jgi:hypothetical protein
MPRSRHKKKAPTDSGSADQPHVAVEAIPGAPRVVSFENMLKMHPIFLAVTAPSPKTAVALTKDCLDRLRAGLSPRDFIKAVNQTALGDNTRSGGYKPLHYAASRANAEVVQMLLDAKASPNARKNNGATPLFSAVFGQYTGSPMDVPMNVADVDQVVARLVDHESFDLEANDPVLPTIAAPSMALGICVRTDFTEADFMLPVVRRLLRRGFNPHARIQGVPSVMLAVFHDHLKTAEAMVQAGAAVDERVDCDALRSQLDEAPCTTLQLCEKLHGTQAAAHLRTVAAASAAAGEAAWRRRHLGPAGHRSEGQGEGGGALALTVHEERARAERAVALAKKLLEAERWPEACCAYEEALSFPSEALSPGERVAAYVFVCFVL